MCAASRAHAAQATAKRENPAPEALEIKGDYSARLSYKERLEFETLERDLPRLESRRDELQAALLAESDHQKMQSLGEELGNLSEQIDLAEMRWLELSERA
mgnify:FL=1